MEGLSDIQSGLNGDASGAASPMTTTGNDPMLSSAGVDLANSAGSARSPVAPVSSNQENGGGGFRSASDYHHHHQLNGRLSPAGGNQSSSFTVVTSYATLTPLAPLQPLPPISTVTAISEKYCGGAQQQHSGSNGSSTALASAEDSPGGGGVTSGPGSGDQGSVAGFPAFLHNSTNSFSLPGINSYNVNIKYEYDIKPPLEQLQSPTAGDGRDDSPPVGQNQPTQPRQHQAMPSIRISNASTGVFNGNAAHFVHASGNAQSAGNGNFVGGSSPPQQQPVQQQPPQTYQITTAPYPAQVIELRTQPPKLEPKQPPQQQAQQQFQQQQPAGLSLPNFDHYSLVADNNGQQQLLQHSGGSLLNSCAPSMLINGMGMVSPHSGPMVVVGADGTMLGTGPIPSQTGVGPKRKGTAGGGLQSASTSSANGGDSSGSDMEELNTKDLAQRISAELKRYSIPQAIFAQRVLCRSQGTLSDLLRNPKPWSKLKSGRETFRRMYKWLEEPEFQRMSALRLAGTFCKYHFRVVTFYIFLY